MISNRTFRFTAFAGILAAAAVAPLSAQALGFGQMRVTSNSGQPLRAEVDISVADRREAIDVVVRNASADDYEKQGLGARGPIAGLTVTLERRGKNVVAVLKTREAVNETHVYVLLEGTTGNGRFLRTYPVLLDVEALQKKPV